MMASARAVRVSFPDTQEVVNDFFMTSVPPKYLEFYKWYYDTIMKLKFPKLSFAAVTPTSVDYTALMKQTPYPIPEKYAKFYVYMNEMEALVNETIRLRKIANAKGKTSPKSLMIINNK